MSTPKQSPSRRPVDEFDVQVVRTIGTVVLDPDGERSAVEAAFAIIARDGDSGEYTFDLPATPHPNPGFSDRPAMRFRITVDAQEIVDGMQRKA